MSRYIDIETIKPRQYENSEVEIGVLAYDYDEVDAMPFIDIVRCKECKHASRDGTYGCMCNHFNDNDWAYHRMYADDFCSYGERKESE